MNQNAMTIITEILPDKLEELNNYLEPIGLDIKNKINKEISFSIYEHLHYCSLFVIPGDHPSPGSSSAPPLLVFEANVDGDVLTFVKELIEKNPTFINKVYSCCADYPGKEASQLTSYLLANDQGANAFYVAHPGQSLNTIYKQREIRGHIQKFIDDNYNQLAASHSESQIHAAVIQHLNSVYLDDIPKVDAQPFLTLYGEKILYGLTAVIVIILVSGLFGWLDFFKFLATLSILSLIAFLVVLRWHEMRDQQDDKPWKVSEQMEAIQRVEDRQLQNHLTSVTEIKPGNFRFYTLKAVLAAISLIARLKATKGNLSGIVTIHFARWVILPGNAGGRRRLLFMSNYDGSWENYLGEFIDYASLGLTAVWCNTQQAKNRCFPDSQWLALGGSRDEQRFKSFARNSQLPELVWYSAYTDLSVKNIENNRRIHAGLFSDTDLAAWLKCL